MSKMKAYLVDIDGTVALRDESRPDCRGPFDWHRVGEDQPNERVIEVVRALHDPERMMIFISGRSGECVDATMWWLSTYVGDEMIDMLIMRLAGDNRPDEVVKRELYYRYVEPLFDVIAVFDDRNKVVKMWRELGLTVLQVADGDF